MVPVEIPIEIPIVQHQPKQVVVYSHKLHYSSVHRSVQAFVHEVGVGSKIKGYAYFGDQHIADRLKCTTRTVRKWLTKAKELDLVRVFSGKGGKRHIHLCWEVLRTYVSEDLYPTMEDFEKATDYKFYHIMSGPEHVKTWKALHKLNRGHKKKMRKIDRPTAAFKRKRKRDKANANTRLVVSISCVKDESGPLGPQNKNPLSEVKSPVPGGSLPRLSGDELEAHASSVKESAPAVKTVETVQPVETGSELARKDPAKQVGSLLGFACADESLKLELFTLVRNHFTRKDVVPVMDGSDGEIRLRKDLAATLDDGLAASPFGGRNDAPGEASTICRARQSCADRKDTREFVFELFQTEIEDMPSGGSGPFFRRVLRAAQKGELKPANTLMRIFRREVLDGLFEDIDACIEGRMEILNAWSKFIKSKSAVWNLTSSLT